MMFKGIRGALSIVPLYLHRHLDALERIAKAEEMLTFEDEPSALVTVELRIDHPSEGQLQLVTVETRRLNLEEQFEPFFFDPQVPSSNVSVLLHAPPMVLITGVAVGATSLFGVGGAGGLRCVGPAKVPVEPGTRIRVEVGAF